MIIDKNGRLFGKVSIVDIGLVLLILTAILFVGIKFLGPKTSDIRNIEPTYVVKVANVKDTSAEYIKPGEALYDGDGVFMGTVLEGIEVKASLALQTSDDGFAHLVEVPGRVDVYVPIKGNAIQNENGIYLDGKVSLLIGTDRFFKASNIDFVGTVIKIDK